MDSSTAYLIFYVVSISSVVWLGYSVFSYSKKTNSNIGPNRLVLLSKDEASRLKSGDPVFLMHLSIALGVGLSIVLILLDPIWQFIPLLRIVLLVVSLPLVGGLVASFVWRAEIFQKSKKVEKDLLHKSQAFIRASTFMQLVLMVAIFFTTSELVLAWFESLAIVAAGFNIVRNVLIAVYYSKPSVNLIQVFDRPLSSIRTPFKISDVLEGKMDASEIKVGVDNLSEFEPYERLSYTSCVEIGACEAACPATAAGRQLSPRVLVRELGLLSKASGERANPFESVNEDELWSCTSCGACVASCPVAVKHLDIVYELRRTLVNASKIDREKSSLLQNLVQNQNPYGSSSSLRADWARDQGIDTFSTNPKAEYLYWVGCVSAFDQRAQKIAISLTKILKQAGVSFSILGNEELCNGDPARRLGEEGRFQELATQNIEKMNSYGIKKIITTCPHCFNTLKNEYPTFGGNFEVIHHTQLISELIKSGKIKIASQKIEEISVTLHDACYASRYNNIFVEPRDILKSAGAEIHEMHRSKAKTFCCGAGGSNYWYKVPAQRTISGIRTEEASKTGAKAIATECPFCLSMFEDSTKVTDTKMLVRDIAEIVATEL
jgi:Fe-S oxidoreductase